MPRGSPDYGLPDYSYFSVETPISDVVAERQGFTRLDNRGRVFWFDDFRNGVSRWRLDVDAGALSPVVVYDTVNAVGFYGSCKLDPVVNGGVATIDSHLSLAVSRRMGLEMCFYLVSNHGGVFIDFQHNFVDGVSKATGLFIEEGTEKIYVVTGSGNVLVVSPSSVAYMLGRWVSIKLVADFSIGKLERLLIGNTQYDISQYTTTNGVGGFSGTTYITASNEGRSAQYKEECYLGYVIISGDEP